MSTEADFAQEVQIQARRIKGLAQAIDDALHDDLTVEERALCFLQLIEEAADKASNAGEEIERRHLNIREEADQ
ncbi:MAG TPA: hypothetical protein VM711_07355 [Sphingomicrobium sp.]|nr:hypothetical protein [Sphingomicrobium sp.]